MRTRGFTLIELMISMALFGLIAAGAMSLVMAGARSQAHSSRVDVAQSGLRTGIDFITRDVLMASAGASSGTITLSSGATVPAIDFITAGNNSATTPGDILDLYLVDGTVAAQATSAVAAGNTTLTYLIEPASGTNTFPAAAPTGGMLQISDLKNALVVPWSTSTATTITWTGALPATTTFLPFPAPTAYILQSRHVVYRVRPTYFGVTNANANGSMLTMQVNGGTEEPLAEGVEDMQIAYGFDDNLDGIITDNDNSSDEWLWNDPGDTVGTHVIANLRAIRVTLVAKSTSVDSGSLFPVIPAAEDRAAGSVKDGFIRRVLRTEIAVRNFNL